jgi:hypothetical protein
MQSADTLDQAVRIVASSTSRTEWNTTGRVQKLDRAQDYRQGDDDARLIHHPFRSKWGAQILAAEHWSLLATRSIAL